MFAMGFAYLSVSVILNERSVLEKFSAFLILLLPLACFWQLFRSFSTVTIVNEIIHTKRPFLKARGINIAHISRVRYRSIMQCMELSNETGENTVRVDYLLEGYERFLNLILGRRPELWYSTGQSVFRVERHTLVLIGGIGTISVLWGAYLAYLNQLGSAAAFLSLSALYYVAAGLTVVHTVTVKPDGIVLHYYLRMLTVPFSSCEDVNLICEFVRSKLHHVVKIDRKGKKALELSGFEDGGIRLFHTINSAFRTVIK